MESAKKKILCIDDEEWIRKLLMDSLAKAGYDPLYCEHGQKAFDILETFAADLIITDINMPIMDGFKFLQKFRTIPKYKIIPVLILSTQGRNEDIIKGLKLGADNYVMKPFSPSVLIEHIQNTFNIATKYSLSNPLTGLPGNHMISDYINDRLAQKQVFAFCYLDLDNFKAYNDYYGFDRGDKVLLYTSSLMRTIFSNDTKNFIGNIGGDDFVVVTPINKFKVLLDGMIKEFDKRIKEFYSSKDALKGYIAGTDREGYIKKFSLISLSIGVVKTDSKKYNSILDLSDAAVEVKKKAKAILGSNYFVNRRESCSII